MERRPEADKAGWDGIPRPGGRARMAGGTWNDRSERMADEDPTGRAPLLRAIGGLLRPFVRILIARGITLPALVRMLKAAYVESARRDFRIEGREPTDSRVSLLTGVHRRDVRAIRGGRAPGPAGPTTLLATVVGRWLAGPETTDAMGRPLPLPRTAREGPSFEALVASVNTDMRARTVLDELLRQGLVAEEGGDLVLAGDAVLGPDDLDQQVLFFARNLGDHLAAAAENLLGEEPAHPERAVFYNRLTAEDVAALVERSRALGQAALLEINREARARQAVSAERAGGTHRFRFGLYVYARDETDDEGPGG